VIIILKAFQVIFKKKEKSFVYSVKNMLNILCLLYSYHIDPHVVII
jgi:hypothetical protein